MTVPYAPIWVKEFIVEELKKYEGFNTVIAVPSSAVSIEDVLKNYKTYPDLVIQYDKLFRFRSNKLYALKAEQSVIYLYGKPEKVFQAEAIIHAALDRADAAAEDVNRWAMAKQGGTDPMLDDSGNPLVHNTYFHNMRVYQLEEARDLGEITSLRGLSMVKMLVEYEYHIINTPDNKYL